MTDIIDQFDFEHKGRKFLARVYRDDDMGKPWEEHDGHGDIREGYTGFSGYAEKRAGEVVIGENSFYARVWLYDFAATIKRARAEGWGPTPHSTHIERGANGLVKVAYHTFQGKALHVFASEWCDDINAAHTEARHLWKASMTARQYAALAVQQDMERMRGWLNDEWHWCGVSVVEKPDHSAAIAALEEAQGSGDELDYAIETLQDAQEAEPEDNYEHALWGIESDSGDYLKEVAIELADDIIG